MPARPAKAWHWLAFLFASILLVALGWQGKRTQEALLETNRSVSDSLEIITSIQAMLSSLQDIETGARGFMLTADSRYLEPYERGLEQLEWRRRALFEQLRGREYPSWHWFDTLDSTIAARLQVAAQNIQSRRSEGLAITIERLQRSGSKELTDRLRGMLNAVEQHERRRLAAANEAVAQATRHSQRLALIGSLLVALLSLAAFWAVQRNLRIRQRLAEGAQAGEARLDALLQAIPTTSTRSTHSAGSPRFRRVHRTADRRRTSSSRCCSTWRRATRTASCARPCGANRRRGGSSRCA